MCGRAVCALRTVIIRNTVRSIQQQHQQQNQQNQQNQLQTSQEKKSESESESENEIEWINEKNFKKSFNLGPGSFLPIITFNENKTKIVTCKWGLINGHIKNLQSASSFSLNLINARIESVLDKKIFRNLLKKNQTGCLFINGFYEWKSNEKNQSKNKKTFFITNSNYNNDNNDLISKKKNKNNDVKIKKEEQKIDLNNVLCLACVYDHWKGENQFKLENKQEDIYSFSVLTKDSKNSNVSDIHDRTPVILNSIEEIIEWIKIGQSENLNKIKNFLEKKIKEKTNFKMWEVSSFVNSMKNDSNKCIQPLELLRKKEGLSRFFKSKKRTREIIDNENNGIKNENNNKIKIEDKDEDVIFIKQEDNNNNNEKIKPRLKKKRKIISPKKNQTIVSFFKKKKSIKKE